MSDRQSNQAKSPAQAFTIPEPTTSWMQDVWRRFVRQKVPVAGAIFLLLLSTVSLLAPYLAPHEPTRQYRDIGLTDLGAPVSPNPQFLLGTDGLGRDVLSRLIHGGRVSLGIGITASSIAVLLGLLTGGVAGFFGGKVDFVMSRFIDLVMSIPTFFLMLLLVVRLGPGVWVIIFVISLFSWTYPARIFRAQVLSVRQREYIEAARCLGVPGRRIFLRHVLPQVLPVIIVYLALSVPTTIFAEASLSFVGMGVPPPTPSWGLMIHEGMAYYRAATWLVLYPGLAISLTVISFNLLGAGLRDAMDPARRGR